MMLLAFVLVAVLFRYIHCIDRDRKEECPALFTPTDLGCKCGFSIEENSLMYQLGKRTMKCNFSATSTSAYLYMSSCMSYNETNNNITLGGCLYNSCTQRHGTQCSGRGIRYVKVPRDRLQINDVICGEINRTGLLCSKCKKGLGPAVFHYGMPCVECLGNVRGWLLYLTLALTFPTVFFILLTTLQIHVSSSTLDSVVLMCQVLVTKFNWSPRYIIVEEPFKSVNLVIFTVYMESGTSTFFATLFLLSVSMRV